MNLKIIILLLLPHLLGASVTEDNVLPLRPDEPLAKHKSASSIEHIAYSCDSFHGEDETHNRLCGARF